MSTPRMHLGWFTSFRPPGWAGPWAGSDWKSWTDGRFHVEMAQALERAGFDYLMLEDSAMVSDNHEDTSEVDLAHVLHAPKHDPVALVPMLAAATSRLGIVATMSTSFYPPYLLARLVATLDHMSHGRAGWNIVTSSEDRAAQNFGMDALPPHDERYDRADEFVAAVSALWETWDRDAVVMDRASHTYADHTKVRDADFRGEFHRTRGPLNTLPMPQRRPVICHAGGSPRGREFAAQHADTITCQARGIEAMAEFRDDIRDSAARLGRDPDSIKVMYVVAPVLADTEDDAVAMAERMSAAERSITSVPLVGTPDSVAERMGEVIEEVGGDGFLIAGRLGRRCLIEVTDGLVPALQRRGLVRSQYEHNRFRDNLLGY